MNQKELNEIRRRFKLTKKRHQQDLRLLCEQQQEIISTSMLRA